MSKEENKSRKCIICGKKAGSGEHIFPSALGGRRKNKGIYCQNHNNWMGAHVDILQKQLEPINAMLEVKPDRGQAKPYIFNHNDGQQYSIAGADIQLTPNIDQILDSDNIGKSQSIKMDPNLLPEIKERARKKGFKLEITEQTPPSTEYCLEPYSIRLNQGGDDAMRATAYLALTFVAHYWPDVARSPGLNSIKDMLRSGKIYRGKDHIEPPTAASNYVSWTQAIIKPSVLSHPTGIGHTIIVCINNGEVVSYISLMDLQCFFIKLGNDDTGSSEKTIVTHIDPLETRYGKDWHIDHFDSALINPPANPKHLEQSILESDQMQQQIAEVFQRIYNRNDHIDAKNAIKEFDIAKSLPPQERFSAIKRFVDRRGQRIINLILFFSRHGSNINPIGAIINAAAIEATKKDATSPDGLNCLARRVLNHVTSKISDWLSEDSTNTMLDEEQYLDIFNGDIGKRLVAIALCVEFMDSKQATNDTANFRNYRSILERFLSITKPSLPRRSRTG